jgi:outer membrane protein
MRMRQPFLCLLLLAFCPCLHAQDKWDLKQCIDYALANNISVQQQDVQARFAALTYKQSKLSQIPTLGVGTSFGINTGRSIDPTTNLYTTQSIFNNGLQLQSNVDLFNFFSKRYTIQANQYENEAAVAAVEKVKNDVALNVASAYLQVLLNREQINISRVQIEQTRAQLSNTRKLVQAGSVPELNALQLEAQVATDSSNLVTSKGTEAQAMLYLKALLNIDAGKAFDITTPPIEAIPLEPLASLEPESVYQLALQNLPLQRVNTLRLKAAQKNEASARGALYPSFSLGGNFGTNYSTIKNVPELLGTSVNGVSPVGVVKNTGDTVIAPNIVPNYRFYSEKYGSQFTNNFSNGIFLNISVPIFNGGIARTALQRAQVNSRSYALQQELDNQTLKQDIYKAYTDAITNLEKFNAANTSVAVAQKAFDFATKRYNIGLLNTIELLTSQSNLYQAQLQRSAAQYQYVFSMKMLEFYKGQGLKL